MARVKGGIGAKKRHNRVLKLAKGYRGARSKQYRVAKQSVMRALTSSYAGRKQRKREFRQLWIARINAAARMNDISYSKLMHGLKVAGVDINTGVHDAFVAACGDYGLEVVADEAYTTDNNTDFLRTAWQDQRQRRRASVPSELLF